MKKKFEENPKVISVLKPGHNLNVSSTTTIITQLFHSEMEVLWRYWDR
jgi:hypothetical protein